MNILEAYQKRLSISEKVYSKEHGGKAMPQTKKIAVARVLANTSEYLTEAYESSVGTQLANMKTFKKFCLDLTSVALPNLISNDLVMVWPMKSRTGFIQYLSFVAGSNKGGVEQGDLFNDPFRLGKMTDNRVNYTASLVVDPVTESDGTYSFTPAWTPVVKGFKTILVNGVRVEFAENFINKYTPAQLETVEYHTYKTIAADGTVAYVDEVVATAGMKVAYHYDNVVIPQNDLPIVNAHVDGISLEAKARRVAIYYSQMAQFQAKTEMGIDLGEVLATQACAELSYEIDNEVVDLLVNGAYRDVDEPDIDFNTAQPVGVNIRDHFAAFAWNIETASQIIYDRTQKYGANFMLASSKIKPLLALMDGWKPVSGAKMNGPYYAGELNGLKVYISPRITAGTFILGFNGDDMMTSSAVFAPYMAIIPTELLGFADGSMSRGFSTLYDLKLLNPLLLVKGRIYYDPQALVITGDTSDGE